MKNRWVNAIIIAIVVLLLDLGALLLGTTKVFHIAWSVGSVGIITFFGMLMLVNYLSESPGFEKGEMRKAIAGSFIAVYFTLVALLGFKGFCSAGTELAKTIIGHFTYLIGIIVVFYFGSSAVRDYLKNKKSK